tara:strand:- start:10996 stop:12009 length:1014 start_codon:yes stop_codon:yes gene_type:complete
MNLFFILSIPVSIILINFFLNKLEVLQSLTGDKHQFFVAKKKIPLSGGLLIVIYSFFLLPFGNELFYFFLIFLIGILSDTKMINSAKIRFLIQFIFIFFLVVKFQLNLDDIKVPFINYFLEYNIFSYSFFAFCLLIVINGTNFIDGLNGLVIGYYSIVLSIILFLGFEEIFFDMNGIILNYLLILFFLLIFNFFDRLYLGDSGSYLIGFALGALLISIYKEIPFFSPFFIVLLLWYPCFENLFSILRKYRFNLSPLRADNKHLHHLLFFFFKTKFKISDITANNFASLFINVTNFVSFIVGVNFIYNSFALIIIIILLIISYVISYFLLFNFRYKKY